MRFRHVVFTAIGLALAAAPALTAQADEKSESKEKETTLDKLPKPAREALVKEAGSDKITKVTEETKNGATVYEAHVKPAQGKAYEIEVDAKGKLLRKGAEDSHHD